MAPQYTTAFQTDVDVSPKTVRPGRRKRFISRLSRFASTPQLRRSKQAQSTDKLLERTSTSCISLASSRRRSTVHITDGEIVETTLELRSPDGVLSPPLVTTATTQPNAPVTNPFTLIPDEVKLHILGYLDNRQRIAASGVCREWNRLCFDGQIWQTLDMTENYMHIPAEQLRKIISESACFIQNMNIRGCLQLESELLITLDALYLCKNLRKLSLQNCNFLERRPIQHILEANPKLEHLNLVGLMTAITSSTSNTISSFNKNLRSLDVSGCKLIKAKNIKRIVISCPQLTSLAASGIRGFGDVSVMHEIHKRNRLESLNLQGCFDFEDAALKVLLIGRDTDMDYADGKPDVEPRRLKYLNLSSCLALSDNSVEMMAGRVPDLEVLLLSRNSRLSGRSLNQILPTVPNLVILKLEELERLSASFCTALASSPCAGKLKHLQLSVCTNIPPDSLSNLVQNLSSLVRLEVDGTNATDSVIEQCLALLKLRLDERPSPNLHLRCFDCTAIRWQAVNAAMIENNNLRQAKNTNPILTMHVNYEWQSTIAEHQTRLERGHSVAAWSLQERWAWKMNSDDRRNESRAMRRSRGAIGRSLGCRVM